MREKDGEGIGAEKEEVRDGRRGEEARWRKRGDVRR